MSAKTYMTEYELFQALRPFYPPREYALLPQAANGTGAGAFRHADALALGLWPSRGMHLSGFEIKCYRGDWLREMRNPEKAEEIAQYCNYWWIVASGPFVKADELPQPWGLMVWDEKKEALTKVKAAPFREALKPDLPFVAAMLRKAQDVVTPDAALEEARREAGEKAKKEAQETVQYQLRDYEKLKERVRKFKKASGVDIDTWMDAGDIGQAVQQVLHGTMISYQKSLRTIANKILQDLDAIEEPRVA